MKLPGRLSATTLGDVLGALHRARAGGVLELEEPSGRRHHVYLAGGLVLDVDTQLAVPRLGELLVAERLVESDVARRTASRQVGQPGRPIGELFVAAGVARGVVSAGLRRQSRARLDALFALRDASLRFHVFGGRRSASEAPLSPREFLHGRPRARGEAPSGGARRTDTRSRHLAVLGLDSGASQADVTRAFRRLARTHHPDLCRDASTRATALRRFAELSSAYHALLTG